MSFTAAAGGFVVGLLSLSVVGGQSNWGETDLTQVCAVEGGTVDLTCDYKYPHTTNHQTTRVMKELWFTKEGKAPVDLRTDSNYTNRWWCDCNEYGCILRITNLKKCDSGIYKYKIRTNHPAGVCLQAIQLSVTDLRVEVTKLHKTRGSKSVELNCQHSCPPHRVYMWFSNGRVMIRETSSSVFVPFQSTDRFSCAVRGFENITSPPVYAPNRPVVAVSPSGEIMEGSSVALTCGSDASPAATYTWYKRESFRNISHGAQLNFTSIQPSDSGGYYCTAENKLGVKRSQYTHIDVECAPTLLSVTSGGRTQSRASVSPGSGKYIAVGMIAAVLLTVAFATVFLWIRKKGVLKESSEPEDRPDNMGQRLPDAAQPEEQFHLHYASIHFINNQTDPPHCNMRADQTHRNMKDEDLTEYSAVKLKNAALRNKNQDVRQDPSELYSTVNKARGTQ
ncbi:hemicentin-1-like isoform X2 [Salarias fasciatus]|uniref:hemicentin-1-like isoform X2 n=1 Tax=Salarias fasciatus TaxID=181472 RepID=UPI001176D2C5|nr:hemicentin-1-like isoform X2 [Salarias fasciatus]